MMEFWNGDPRVPEYINKMEESQKKATHTGLPITYDRLLAIASFFLLSAGSFPKQRPEYDGLSSSAKDWTAWESTFGTAQITVKREQRATNTRGDLLGTTNSAAAIHGIKLPSSNPYSNPASISDQASMFYHLDSHLNNIVMAATNKKAVLEQLTANNARFTALTSDQYNRIEKLLRSCSACFTAIPLSTPSSNQTQT